jgi:hypothetical protein
MRCTRLLALMLKKWSPEPGFRMTSLRIVGCPFQLLLDTTTALCFSRDLANAFPPTQCSPERRPRGRNMALMADDHIVRSAPA